MTKRPYEKHGMTKTPEYTIWKSMKDRCNNPQSAWYPHYGGRGICVCQRWMASFLAFITDMGRRPAKHLSIERLNNDLGYSPENCKWATQREQNLNQRGYGYSRYKGVRRSGSKKNPWNAVIRIGKRDIHLGNFSTEEEASNAYMEYKRKYRKD